ncbi:hypothetical protein ACSBR2_024986 [Camellia fascicularis]
MGASADEFERERAGDPFWVFRIIGYPVLSHANGKDMTENDIGCGAHTDYGLLPLVNQDADITALETNFDAAIEPLDICIKQTGGAKKFEIAVYGEHLVSKVTTDFVKEDDLDS